MPSTTMTESQDFVDIATAGPARAYHVPVMLAECMAALNIQPEGIYVDVTMGGGGHTRAMLAALGPAGKLIAFDQDEDAVANAPEDSRLTLVQDTFARMKRYLRLYGGMPCHGILADLGVSSHQLDEAGRGFTFRNSGPLDMRMDRRAGTTAQQWLATVAEDELARTLRMYGELQGSRGLARAVVLARSQNKLNTTADLADALGSRLPREARSQGLAKAFQAIRIHLNGEMDALRALLEQAAEALAPGGRLVVMSYHSLEDRLVKHFLRSGNFEGTVHRDLYGHTLLPFELLQSKATVPTPEELTANPRSRSARLRAATRTAVPYTQPTTAQHGQS